MRAVLSLIATLGGVYALLTDEAILRIRIEAEITAQAERFRLGDIASVEGGTPSQREQLKQIELGAAPLPGQKRLFTRQQLLTRLRQHGIDPQMLQIEMPDTVRITRMAQSLSMDALERFAQEQLTRFLGESAAHWQLERGKTTETLALPEGDLSFRLMGEPRIGTDTATLEVEVLVNGQPKAQRMLRFRTPQRARTLLVRSGETVQVQVRAEGVLLEVSGLARASGAEGEVIPVYIPTTQKTVRARVMDKGRVEVIL
ncbi:MAG: flagella basal body P-ring formation protein FlgA [Armatimonadota bacterium]